MEGNYFCDAETLATLKRDDRIAFRYATAAGEMTAEANPNGSLENIAGILERGAQRAGHDAASGPVERGAAGVGGRAAALPVDGAQPGHGVGGQPQNTRGGGTLAVQWSTFIIIFFPGWTTGPTAWRPRSRWRGWRWPRASRTSSARRTRTATTTSIQSVNAARTDELRARLADEKIPLTLGLGCDFHLSFDNVKLALADPARFSINGLGYLLVEVPDYGLPPGLTETFYQLQLAGLTPILTHPERNPTLQNEPERLIEWLRGGRADPGDGGLADRAQGQGAREQMAHELLEKRWVHFLATDAHNITTRPPRMREATIWWRKIRRSYAHSLCVTNPHGRLPGQAVRGGRGAARAGGRGEDCRTGGSA